MAEQAQVEQEPKKKRKYNMTKPRPNSKDQILRAAVKVMCHYGYDSTTMEKIAEEAGVSRQIVARFFGTSDNIAGICVKHVCDTILTQVQDIAETSADYTEQTDRMFAFVKRSQDELRLLISLFATPNLVPIVREAMPGLTMSMRALVSKHNPELPEQEVAALSYNMTALYFHYALTSREDLFLQARDTVFGQYRKKDASST